MYNMYINQVPICIPMMLKEMEIDPTIRHRCIYLCLKPWRNEVDEELITVDESFNLNSETACDADSHLPTLINSHPFFIPSHERITTA